MKIKYFQAGSSIPVKGTKLTVPSSLQMPKQVKQDNVNPVTPPAFIREFALASQNPEAKAMYDDIAIRSQVIGRRDAEALRQKVMPMNNGQRMFKSSQNEQYWLNEANKYGKFNNIQEVIDWQKANGLVADGKFGNNSIAKWNQLNPKPAVTSAAPAAPTASATPQYIPFYPSDQSYVAAIQYANGQKPTGVIDNTTATLLRINRDINNQWRQNEKDKKENLERQWDQYEYNAVNNALKNPNDYYGLPLSKDDHSWGWTDEYNQRGLDAANEKYQYRNGLYNPAYALKRNALDLAVPSPQSEQSTKNNSSKSTPAPKFTNAGSLYTGYGAGWVPRRKEGGIMKFALGGSALDQKVEQLLSDPDNIVQNLNGITDENELNYIIGKIKEKARTDSRANRALQILAQTAQQIKQQQAQMAEKGAKLQFIKSLRGICPEGEQLTYMLKGGVMCPVCKKGAKAPENKRQEFFKREPKTPLAKCGCKAKMDKCGGKAKMKKK